MIGFAVSKNGVKIRLTEERWYHIIESHDNLSGLSDLVLTAIENPDTIIKGSKDELIAAKEYKNRNLIVVYKESEEDGFVITAFLTRDLERIKKKGVIWKRQS